MPQLRLMMLVCACGQSTDAIWMSMLLSASAGMLAVTVVVGTFYFIRCIPLIKAFLAAVLQPDVDASGLHKIQCLSENNA